MIRARGGGGRPLLSYSWVGLSKRQVLLWIKWERLFVENRSFYEKWGENYDNLEEEYECIALIAEIPGKSDENLKNTVLIEGTR